MKILVYTLFLIGLCASMADSRAQEAIPSLFIIGDSTASNSKDLGWGSHLGKYFDADQVAVINRARGGRSSRTFHSEGLWEKVRSELKPGDQVLIQFGHNDGGQPGKGKDRGSLGGTGAETVDITKESGEVETVHTFGHYMRKFIAEVREKGAVPIVLSLTVRNEWAGGKVERGPGSFSKWSEEIAAAEGAAFVDVNNIIGQAYERIGQEAVKPFFPLDHTHTSAEGADVNARCVVAGLRAVSGEVFDPWLSGPGKLIQPVNPTSQGKASPFPVPGRLLPEHHRALPTVFFVGDSTVKNGRDDGADGLWGWANPVAAFFDRSRINVENEALGGTSSRTYRSAGHWGNVLALVRPGDYVVMQFGHNDSSPVNDKSRARGTIRGNGDETEEIDNLLTGEHETVHSYGWYIRQFIAETKAKGATPIVCSPVPRNSWNGDTLNRGEGSYGEWARQASEAAGAAFIDLQTRVADEYERIGKAAVQAYFPKDHTHTGRAGAEFNAKLAVEGIRELEGCDLAGYLSPLVP
ncbi:MAG: rhamnogalacturonan acetylesterase [Verrucomicrobiae bacterium]|nr:rhamnogalacturonan acetylesterase [Verrucomicrobiae bacterium]